MGPDNYPNPVATQGDAETYEVKVFSSEKEDAAVSTFRVLLKILLAILKALPWIFLILACCILVNMGIKSAKEDCSWPEITLLDYDIIASDVEGFPGLKDTTQKLMANDGRIDIHEYSKIKELKEVLKMEEKRNKLIRAIAE